MMTNLQTSTTCQFCNLGAKEKGLNPVGHAASFDDAVIMEHPFPWKRDYRETGLPDKVLDLLNVWMEHYQQTGEYNHRALLIAPDETYSVDGMRRVMFYSQPDGLFAQYAKTEYLLPNDEVGSLIWAWYQDRETLEQYEQYRQRDHDMTRDILVCTHGTVDAACAKFGYPLYKHMRDTYADDNLRVWRVSHFGGHAFAPTIMDMPHGHYWAYVEDEQAKQIIERECEVTNLRGHYRGWVGVEYGFVQVAEYHLWQEIGWEWLDYKKSGHILKRDNSDEPQWADVQIDYLPPHEEKTVSRIVRVEVTSYLEIQPATGKDDTYPYPQFVVNEIETV